MGRRADTSNYTPEELQIWELIREQEERLFYTAKGLPFHIRIVGNELFVDRREKSITRASVNIAYHKMKELGPDCGPKALGVFGASYIWGILTVLSQFQC